MASYYPHKQTAFIAILCIIAVGGTFIYAKGNPSPSSSQKGAPLNTNLAVKTPERLISTSTDWRKSFLTGTTSAIVKTNPEKSSGNEQLTLTDQFGRDFFARYIQLKQSGLRENEEFVTDSLNNSIEKTASLAQQAKVYTRSDILVQSDSSAATIRAYGNAVGSIFSTYGVDGDPATIANDAFERGDMTVLKELDSVIISYITIASMLKNTPVPQSLAAYHLELLNGVSGMVKISQDLRNVEGDPMQAMVSIGQYSSVHTSLLGSLKNMKTYFSTVPVVFDATEPGSLFSLIL